MTPRLDLIVDQKDIRKMIKYIIQQRRDSSRIKKSTTREVVRNILDNTIKILEIDNKVLQTSKRQIFKLIYRCITSNRLPTDVFKNICMFVPTDYIIYCIFENTHTKKYSNKQLKANFEITT